MATSTIGRNLQDEKADVLLVTVTDVEFDAVVGELRRQFVRTFVRYFKGNKTYFDLGEIGDARTFLVRSEMGPGGSGGAIMTVTQGIQDLGPSAVVMVGIAFGVDPAHQHIADVLVSRQIFDYDLQRVGADGIIYRGDKVPASTRLLDRFRGGRADWKGARLHFGVMLAGSRLIDNLDLRDELRKREPEAIGGEMEGAGLYAAAAAQKVDWILVKGISDWADGSKDVNRRQYQPTAARNATRFVFHVLHLGGVA
jgi:nucleoside phosphorylase